MIEFQRVSWEVPGYICPDYCKPECPARVAKHPNNCHGRHGNDWHFAVKSIEHGAIALWLYTPFLSEPIPADLRKRFYDDLRGTLHTADGVRKLGFMPVNLIYHSPWVLSAANVRTGVPASGSCNLVERCMDTADAGSSDAFAEAHFVPPTVNDKTQPESFWLAMQASLIREYDAAQVARRTHGDLRYEQCSSCKGHGIVDRT